VSVLNSRLTARLGIRARSTIAAVVVVGAALAVSGIVVVLLVRITLNNGVIQSVTQRATDVTAQIASAGVESAKPTVAASSVDGTVVQVFTPTGKVLLASPGLTGNTPLTAARPAPGQTIRAEEVLPIGNSDEPHWVTSIGVATASGPVVVLAARSSRNTETTYHTVGYLLLAVAPLLMAAAGAVTWVAVGQSLTTVDRMRRRVDTIEASGLDQRVPVPPSTDEIAQLAVTMNQMLDRLERSSLTQRRFVADASHELRSPLASLRASLDVTRQSDDPAAWREAEPVMQDEVERMTHLVDDLLLLAKADEGDLPVRHIEVDLDDLVLGEVARLRSQTTLTITSEVEPTRFTGDPARLAQALRNLTDNASRFATSAVALHLEQDRSLIRITVDDDGPGIPSADRARVTERFVRLENHRSRSQGGSGLGLSIVVEIVRAHGGELAFDVSPSGGNRALISFPRK
jgi:signal transduction histidine kinase